MAERSGDGQHTLKTFNTCAKAYEEKFMPLGLYNDSYDVFCSLMKKPSAKILELGCGPGNITKYIRSKRPDFKVLATDIAPNMLDLAKKNNPEAEFKIIDAREIHKLTAVFDGIVCGFCIPYLSMEECRVLFTDCGRLLSDEGIFYFSFIEGNYEDSGFEYSSDGSNKCYVHYYQKEFFYDLVKECGFELQEEFMKGYSRSSGIEQHIVVIAKRK